MRLKQKIKIITDCAMTVFLPILMAYSLVGEALHEWIGTMMLLFLVIHHILNIHKPSVKSPVACMNTALNFILFILLLLLIGSGIVMSRTVFRFLPFDGEWETARTLHLPLAYWSYILMSVHLGLHLNAILAITRNITGGRHYAVKTVVLRLFAGIVSAYGIYGFFSRDFPGYLFLRNHFVFLDYEEPLVFFFADYLAITVLFAAIGYLIMKLIQCRKKTNMEETA